MASPEKVAVVDEVREELSENPATLLTEYRGLSVGDMAELRAALREAGARYVVVKNTLARIAARDAGYESLEDLFTGPTALTYCGDDPVRPAKALRRFAKDHPELVVKGGVLEGRVVDADTAEGLADLRTREELLERFTQLLYGALANTASLMQAPIRDMARLVAALEEEGVNPPGEPTDEVGVVAEADGADAAAPDEDDAEDEPPPAEDAAEAVEEAAGTAADAVETAGEVAADAAGSAADAVGADEAGGAVADAVETAGEAAADAVETAGDAAADAVETAAEAASDAVETAEEAVGGDETEPSGDTPEASGDTPDDGDDETDDSDDEEAPA